MRIPLEREWLARETIADLERCWRYVNSVTGERLAKRILIEVAWERTEIFTDFQESSISIGMGHPAAAVQSKPFLMRTAAREIARLGLAELSRGGTLREENRFLDAGMAEIIAHEYHGSTKALEGAWVLAHFMDRMNPLGLATQAAWSTFSLGRRDLRSAAPGVTLLMTCRELFGRERTSKLFEALKKGSLEESVAATFKSSADALENAWLKKVKEYRSQEDITVTSEEDAPVLLQTVFVPATGQPGSTLQIKLFIQDRGNDLFPGSVFVEDQNSGRVLQGQTSGEKETKFILVEIPIDERRQPGRYSLRTIAVDETGNIRHWEGSYAVIASSAH
ncbi:MAG: hypothetical protein ACREQA_06655 [Candidatus Binatia bacterium]